ncbi:MAG: TonB-dependent receptor, partial [Acidobacteriia bacterium]|nr:TonB-dependent receptor [Terriglobia bacterium]
GFTIGGPVWIPKIYNGHDKTFFFFNWEQYREHVTINTQLETVPTDAYRRGDFSAALIGSPIGTDPLGRPIYQNEIYDPNTTRTFNGQPIRDPFPNQMIPASMFDPVALKIQALFPEPVGPSANGLVNNYVPNIPTSRVTEIPSLKVDQVIGSKGKLSFFWQRTKTTAPLSFTFGQVDGLPDPLATNAGTFQHAPVYRANYDHTVTPTVLFHFGGGYRSNYFFVPTVNEEGQVPNYNAEQQLGLHGGTTHQFFPPMNGLCTGPGPMTPYLCTGQGGMQNFGGAAYGVNQTQAETANTSLTWVKNNHTYKFGGELRIEGYPVQSRANTSGTYSFAPDQTGLPYLNGTTLSGQTPGFAYASFLLGDVKTVSISNPVAPRLGKHQLGFYAQDSWKVTRRLTVDYGLRYDFSTYLKEEHGRDPFFSPTVPNPAVGNIPGAIIFEGYGPGHCNCELAKNYPWALGPRLGIAFQINSKTVARGGFGIIYGSTESNNNASAGLAGSTNTVTAPSFGAAVTTLSVGIPASFNPAPWPNLDPGQFNTTKTPVSLAGAPGQAWLDPNAGRPPRQYQWSVGIQREILANLVAEATYVGNRGIWWQAPALLNINELTAARLAQFGLSLNNPADVSLLTQQVGSPAVVARNLNIQPYPGFPLTQTLAQALRPFPQFTTIDSIWDPLGDTWYNSLQVKVTKRLSHGLSFLSTFSWQKTLVNGTEIGEPNPGTTGNAVVNDPYNRPLNKYLSLYDQPFLFNISLTYVTPAIHRGRVLSWVLRDWTYGAFLQYSSGFPIQVPFANNNLNTTLFAAIPGSPVTGTGTFADRVPGQPLFTVDLNCHCYDPNKTFALNPNAWVNPPAGQYGTSAAYYSDYRTQRRPGENMNFGRTWRFKEQMSLSVRIEFTNVFNRAYWGNPANTNAQATQTKQPNGNAASGFGFMNTLTPGFTGAQLPRNGTLVAKFSF